MKKIFLPLLLCVILLFSGCGEPENKVTPPFFKITDPNTGGVVYLLGTMHVGLENTVYPDEVYAALDECSALAVEIDLQALDTDQQRISAAMKLLECKDETAADFLGGDYAEIRAFFESKRMYGSTLERYIPSVWSSTLSNRLASDCGYSSQYGTDRALLSLAKERSMKIVELESVEEQYQMNADEPRGLQIYSLKTSVQTDYEVLKNQIRELYRAWSEGDGAALEKMLREEEVPEDLKEEYAQYYYAMYEARQEKMAAYINEALGKGDKIFVAVGALHCYAAPDILDLIDEGAVIEAVRSED